MLRIPRKFKKEMKKSEKGSGQYLFRIEPAGGKRDSEDDAEEKPDKGAWQCRGK